MENNTTPQPITEPTPAPQPIKIAARPVPVQPQAVVQVLSPRGVEYVFLTIALFTVEAGLISALLSLIHGETGFDVLSFPAALLLTSVPVFAGLFLRLKKAELAEPNLRLDASKRRSTQTIQIVNFLISFFTVVGVITAAFAKMSGNYDGSTVKLLLDGLVLFAIPGLVLAYYWFDEHRN